MNALKKLNLELLTDEELIEYEELLDLELIDYSRESFWDFCMYMDPEFFTLREHILKPIAIDMQRLIKPRPPETELDILNVSLPPRTGKSYLCSLFCAWAIGHFPTKSIMRNTVTQKLYNKFSNDLKKIILGHTHKGRLAKVFPHVILASEAVEGWEIKGAEQGVTYFGSGFEGSIIGFGCSLLSIVDDSVKDQFDALNPNSLDKKWGWYTSAQDSREEEGCKKLFIGTRWSKDDIVGKLEANDFFKGDKAMQHVVPCLINGETYCEAVHSTETLLKKKKICSELIWAAEWMQTPIDAYGRLFAGQLKRFRMEDLEGAEPIGCISWTDVADEGSDFLSKPFGYMYGEDLYITDVIFTKKRIEATKPIIIKALLKHVPFQDYYESNNGGKSFAISIKETIKMFTSKVKVKWKFEYQNKSTRIYVESGYIINNIYFLHPDEYEQGSDYSKFIKNIEDYSHIGKNVNDDGPDSVHGIAKLHQLIIGKKKRKENKNK